jgi:hypothetical protein
MESEDEAHVAQLHPRFDIAPSRSPQLVRALVVGLAAGLLLGTLIYRTRA